jgi:hypothetical protein
MQRRDALRGLMALSIPGLLTACGGGGSAGYNPDTSTPEITQFSSDKTSYFIGEPAVFTATFTNGSGSLQPYGNAISSNVSQTLPRLTSSTITLQVKAGTTVTRALQVTLKYRNQWQAIAMGAARANHQTAQFGDKLYVLGGYGAALSFPANVLVFDAISEKFSAAGDLLSGRVKHTATMLKGGAGILVVGGSRDVAGAPAAEYYDCASGKSRATTGQPQGNRMFHTATLLADGKVLLAGGSVSLEGVTTSSADLYDPATDRFTRLAGGMRFARVSHSASLLRNGKVLIVNGENGNAGQVLPPELFDPATQSVTALAAAPGDTIPRTEVATVNLDNGDVLQLGGTDFFGGVADGGVFTFAAATSSTTRTGKLLAPRALLATVGLLDGRVLVVGGSNGDASQNAQALSSSEIYAPDSGISTAAASMASARMDHTADLLSTGKVLVVGGKPSALVVSTTAELYS